MNVQEAQNCVQSVRFSRGPELCGQSAHLTYFSESESLASALLSGPLLDERWLADRWIIVLWICVMIRVAETVLCTEWSAALTSASRYSSCFEKSVIEG